jgi:hypothetical protein
MGLSLTKAEIPVRDLSDRLAERLGSPSKFLCQKGDFVMCKKFCFALVAVALMAVGARAADKLTKIDLGSVRDVDSTVVESKLAFDVDGIATKTADKNEQAVEACCRSYCCYNSCCYRPCCYSYCYSPCYSYCYYPTYSYCCYPTYTCSYCPTYSCCYYPTYSYSYSCYQPSYSCYSSWGCY